MIDNYQKICIRVNSGSRIRALLLGCTATCYHALPGRAYKLLTYLYEGINYVDSLR